MTKFLDNHPVLHSLAHGVLAVIVVGLPVLLQALPADWMNMTVGGVALALLHLIENSAI